MNRPSLHRVLAVLLPFVPQLVVAFLVLGNPLPEASVLQVGNTGESPSAPFASTTTTLREYITAASLEDGTAEGFYLGMGPAFFGFFGYFGSLAGIEDELFSSGRDPRTFGAAEGPATFSSRTSLLVERKLLKGVSGASAGAMAAVLLAAGISPHAASAFATSLGLSDFADPGGLGGVMKGDRFESLMAEFLQSASPIADGNATYTTAANTTYSLGPHWPLGLEDAMVPVAVSTVDVLPQIKSSSSPNGASWWQAFVSSLSYLTSTYAPTPKILIQGSMARAARASACFPGLFQPVGWIDRGSDISTARMESCNNTESSENINDYSLLIDGGIFDWAGCNGLKEILSTTDNRRPIKVLNIGMGGFGPGAPPGPEELSRTLGVTVDSVFSFSIVGLPKCGPLSMPNGRLANSGARSATRDAMDRPVVSSGRTNRQQQKQKQKQHHFVLEIDASSYVDQTP